jgi:hypothetical protein
LTVDPAVRGRRAIAAAQAEFEAGAADITADLLVLADRCPLDDLSRAALVRLRAQVVFARNRGKDAAPLLLEAARQLELLDLAAARETYLEALGAAIFAGRLGTNPGLLEVADLVRAAPRMPDAPRPIDLLLDGTALRFAAGHAASVPLLRDALDAFEQQARGEGNARMHWFWLAFLLAGELYDDAMWHHLATRAVQLARDEGALGELPIALTYRAFVHLYAGEFTAASTLIAEADAIAAITGQAPLVWARVFLAGWQGTFVAPSDAFASAVRDGLHRGEGRVIGVLGFVMALWCRPRP